MSYEHDRSIKMPTKSLVVRKFAPPGFSMVSLDPVSEIPAIDPLVTSTITVMRSSLVEPIPECTVWDA
jgi:hypothetical protein